MANIKQNDLLKYLADKFNDNSFGIPFKMGSYEAFEDASNRIHMFIYAPQNANDGKFDEKFAFDETTYQTEKSNFVVMSGGIASGEYTPLPNVQMVSYDVTLSFLVFVDNPISEIIRMAIEEVRDKMIGNLDKILITEVDLTSEEDDAPLINDYLRIVTTADSIVFGAVDEIMGRRYMEYSLTVTMTVSKNVEFGNQFEWSIAKVDYTYTWQLTTPNLLAPYNYTSTTFGNLVAPTKDGLKARVGVGTYDYYISVATEKALQTSDYKPIVPLIADFGTSQDLESFQTLRSVSTSNDKYKQVHNYVKSRGYAMTWTLLFDSSDDMNRTLFKECFTVLETPNIYVITMKFKELNETTGLFVYNSDMQRTTRVVLEEAMPNQIVYGEPIAYSLGFSVSAK